MTALAPWSMAYLIVGTAPAIRWVFVTFLSESRGTLKSTCKIQCHVRYILEWFRHAWEQLTLINTRLSLRSTSVIESLFERDISTIDDLPVFFEEFTRD